MIMSAVSRASESASDLPLVGSIVPSAPNEKRTVVLKPWRWLRIFANIGRASSLRYSSSPERRTTCLPVAFDPAGGLSTSEFWAAAVSVAAKTETMARRRAA